MKDQIGELLLRALTLAVSSAAISAVYWLVLVFLVGVSIPFLKLYGCFLLYEMSVNKILSHFQE